MSMGTVPGEPFKQKFILTNRLIFQIYKNYRKQMRQMRLILSVN